MNNIIILIIAIIIHEFGHYATYRLFGYKADVKLKWWGIQVGTNVHYKTYPYQAYFIFLVGIISGTVIVWNTNIMTLYLFMCMVDFVGILQILSFDKKQHKMTLLECAEYDIKKIEDSMQ